MGCCKEATRGRASSPGRFVPFLQGYKNTLGGVINGESLDIMPFTDVNNPLLYQEFNLLYSLNSKLIKPGYSFLGILINELNEQIKIEKYHLKI